MCLNIFLMRLMACVIIKSFNNMHNRYNTKHMAKFTQTREKLNNNPIPHASIWSSCHPIDKSYTKPALTLVAVAKFFLPFHTDTCEYPTFNSGVTIINRARHNTLPFVFVRICRLQRPTEHNQSTPPSRYRVRLIDSNTHRLILATHTINSNRSKQFAVRLITQTNIIYGNQVHTHPNTMFFSSSYI